MRTTYQKPTSFRSNADPESVKGEVVKLLAGNEMEAMRAQQENFELTSPSPVPAAASRSWSELSQSKSLDASERARGGMLAAAKEESGGKSWGEVRSDPVGGLMLQPIRLQPRKGAESKVEKENIKYGPGKATATKEEEVEGKEKEDTEKKSLDKEEEKLEPERTMEGLAESSEETNSLQAFRAVEKR